MRVALLVLGVALLCAVVSTQQEVPRGRERLRELVQKARAGDTEAQAILASRRRNIANNKAEGSGRRDQNAVEAALAGPRLSTFRRPSFQPSTTTNERPAAPRPRLGLSSRNRQRGGSRSRARGGRQESEVAPTTFRPSLATEGTPAPTTAAPIELTPIPVEELVTEPPQIFIEEPVVEEQQTVDLTPSNFIPSLFQPAQFGQQPAPQPIESSRRAQPAPQLVERTREPSRRPESRQQQRISIDNIPHRALNRGLETGDRSELFTPVAQDPNSETTSRAPPVQTIRRYSYFDEAGNYVFGYEAEDGSFKEEIRGRDCIVNGKYGYVDPTGIRREFSYVSGNKCDPNNPDNSLQGLPVTQNDQFLQQTQTQQLNESELAKLSLNRARKPNARTQTIAKRPRPAEPAPIRQRPSVRPSSRTAPERTQRLRPVSEPARQPAVVKSKPSEKPVDLTPTRIIPNMFQPAQFNDKAPQSNRFPVPDFISQSSRPRQPAPERVQAPVRIQTEAPTTRPPTTRVTLPPTPPPTRAPVRAPSRPLPGAFNFDQEFSNVFAHFGNSGAPVPPPAPVRPASSVPSLFQPAQFKPVQPRPAPTPAPAPKQAPKPVSPPRPDFNDQSFVLTSQQPRGTPQLVFDATTGTFKTIHVQNNSQIRPAAPRPAPPPPQPKPQSAPALPQNPFLTSGRALPLFGSNPTLTNSNRNSPLPPIPTSAAEFDQFFAQFRG